jgi:hypothetical protein
MSEGIAPGSAKLFTFTANSVGAFISAGEWRLLVPPKQLYRFAEADDRSGGSAAPTVDRPQPDRSLDTAAYLARN